MFHWGSAPPEKLETTALERRKNVEREATILIIHFGVKLNFF